METYEKFVKAHPSCTHCPDTALSTAKRGGKLEYPDKDCKVCSARDVVEGKRERRVKAVTLRRVSHYVYEVVR